MRYYTTHLRASRPPVLLKEAFSWGACVFGPFWFLAHGAWVTAILVAALDLALAFRVRGLLGVVLPLWVMWVLGVFGRDLLRLHFLHRRYHEAHVVAARDEAAAFARLLAARPDQMTADL